MHFAVALLPLVVSAQAAISILYPRTDSIWYKNTTVNLNWTVSDPATDIYLFRAILSNEDTSILSSSQGIADSTNATAGFVKIALPRLQAAQGYVVTLVNTTNESQVFATSEAFEIQDGAVRNQTSTTAGASQTSTRAAEIPNGQSQGSFPSSSFPSASPTGGARHGAQLDLLGGGIMAQGAAMGLMVLGAAAILL